LSTEITSTNPTVRAIIGGTAPPAARFAAASGLLPLPQTDLLEVLVALRQSDDAELAVAAEETLQSQTADDILIAAKSVDTAPLVLDYLATITTAGQPLQEAIVLNSRTPDRAVANVASIATNPAILELIAANQQRLVRFPEIIDAILSNSARSPEAERRAQETRREFFEKERGAQQIAQELRARGKNAAAEFFESAELRGMSADDAWLIAEHIEVSDADLDHSWLPAERYEELADETAEDDEVKSGNTASPRWGLAGFYAKVIQPGTLRPGDAVALLEERDRIALRHAEARRLIDRCRIELLEMGQRLRGRPLRDGRDG